MKCFKKFKNKLGVLALFALLFQLTMPIYQSYVYAQEDGIEESIENDVDTLSEVETEADMDVDNLQQEIEMEVDGGELDNNPQQEIGGEPDKTKEDTESDGDSSVEETKSEEETNLDDSEGKEDVEKSKKQKDNNSADKDVDEKPIIQLNNEVQSIEKYFDVDEDSNILTEGKLTFRNEEAGSTTTPTLSSIARTDFSWEIHGDVATQVKAGDFFEFDLPKELKLTQVHEGNLVDSDGTIYGSFEATPTRKVVMTFNDEVKNHPAGITGELWFESRLDEKEITEAGKVEIVLPVKEQEGKEVFIKTDYVKSIEKQGKIDKKLNPTKVTWTVDFNKGLNELTNAKVTEKFPEGNQYDSVKIYRLKVNLNGKVIGKEEVDSGFEVDDNGNVTFPGKINNAYRLVYEAKILDTIKEDTGNSVDLINTATLTSDESDEKLNVKATQTANFGKLINKDRGKYDAKTQTFSWIARYNYGIKEIKKENAKLVDVMDEKLKVVPGTIILKEVTPTAEKSEKDVRTLTESTDYEVVKTEDGFKINFLKDVDYAVKMTYDTKVKEDIYIDNDNAGKVTNKITVGGETSTGSNGTISQQGIIKSGATIDYSQKTIQWKILVNQNGYEMNNATISDDFDNEGLTLEDKGKFIITDTTQNKELKQGTDYDLTIKSENAGFDVEFIGDYVKTSSAFTITYETPYVFNDLKDGTSKFKNSAKLKWTDDKDNSRSNTDSDEVNPKQETKNNGFKNGSYNAVTKTITWTVGVNYNGEVLEEGAQITDPITGNQVYVPKSAELYEYTVDKDGNYNYDEDNPVNPSNIVEPTDEENTLTVNLPSDAVGTTKAYLLKFETSLKDQVIEKETEYTNKAVFTNGDNPQRDLIGTVSIKHGGKLVEKDGNQRKEDGRFVDWKIYINRSQSTVEDVVIVDEPTPNQVFVSGSLAIYPLTVNSNGKFTKEDNALEEGKDYTLKVTTDNLTGQQTITAAFSEKIETAYVMEYSTLLSLDEGDKSVRNKMSFAGKNKEEVTTSTNKLVEVSSSSGGGSASGKKGTITFQKLGSDGKLMEGVKFELWNKDKTQVIRTGSIDSEGKLTFGNLIYNDYYLKEVETLSGYTVSDELVKGKIVTVNKASSESTEDIDVGLTNELSKVIINKESETGTPLKDTEFKVSKKTDTGYEVIDAYKSVKTNSSGKIILEGLVPGDYRLEELTAPTGYLLNTKPIDFKVRKKGIQVPTVTVKAINYQGSAQLIKKDQDGNPLAGAEFSIIDEGGEVVQEKLSSNKDGLVTVSNLAPGKYRFKETKAADGYILNDQEIEFTIEAEAKGKPELVSTGELKNYQGSVELTKYDANGELLSDAVFELSGDNGYEATEFTTIDGKITVTSLAPGNYVFKEVTAPAGFILNTRTILFEVKAVQTGEPNLIKVAASNYKGTAQLQKVDKKGNGLANAKFSIVDAEGETIQSDLVTDEKGIVKATDLSPGKYSFKEIKAPEGYILNTSQKEFTIVAETEDEPMLVDVGELTNYKGSALLVKVNQKGNPLEESEFAVLDKDGGIIQEGLKSNEQGMVTATELSPGTYRFKETRATPGYILNDREVEFIIDAEVAGEPEVVETEEFMNYQGTAQLIKTDKDDNPLMGAEFSVLDESGEIIREGLLSDAEGYVNVTDLAPGIYRFRETKAAEGYILNDEEVEFTIESEATDMPSIVYTGTFNNYQGSIELSKLDKEGNLLSDAVFELIGDNGYEATEFTTKDGKITVNDLEPGKYEFKEIRAPKGFVLNTLIIPFEIKAVQTGEPELIVLSVSNYQGSAQLLKVDENGKKLAGAEFSILNKEGQTVQSHLTSNEKGIVMGTGLAPGEYSFKETKAPEGYILNTTQVSFTILEEAEEQPTVVHAGELKNYQGSVTLTKVNSDKVSDVLAGAEFNLVDKDGKTLQSRLKTDGKGRINIIDLAPGEYAFVEIKAPEGYELYTKPIKFTVISEFAEQPENIELQVGNTKVVTSKSDDSELPKTGQISSLVLYAIGGLLVVTGLVVGKRRAEE